jgi:hypothetical protein
MAAIFIEEMPRSRVAVLLEHFSQIEDGREPWRVAYPLAEVLLLLTCATIADCDDFDEIVAWGEHHLDFLRRFAPFHFGIPCARWLRTLVNPNFTLLRAKRLILLGAAQLCSHKIF